jgi:hypothetical protein
MDTPDVLAWRDGYIEALDQTALPHQIRVLRITTVDQLVEAITTLAVRGAPVLGGFVRTELGNVTGLGLLGYGFVPAGTPFCGCFVGHEWGAILVATSNVLNIPMNPLFCGTVLRVQGADFGGAGGCPSPAVTFTSTFQIALN